MAMFTLIEINGDHINDLVDNIQLEAGMLGSVLQAVVRNTSSAYLLEQYGLERVIRIVRQSGEQA